MHPQWPSPFPLLYQESLSTRSIHSGTPLPLRTGITDFQCTQGLTQWLQPSSEPFHHTDPGHNQGIQVLGGVSPGSACPAGSPQRGFLCFQSQQPISEAASSQTSHLGEGVFLKAWGDRTWGNGLRLKESRVR